MLAETPASLAEQKRKVIDHESYAKIARFFEEQPRLVKVGDDAWRYLHGLTDKAVADLLKARVPDICENWVAFVRRKKGLRLHTRTTGNRAAMKHADNLEERVKVLEERVEKLWAALNY